MIIKIIMTIALLVVFPLILGGQMLKTGGWKSDTFGLALLWTILMGNTVMWGIFEIIAVPNILGSDSMMIVLGAWGLMLVLCIFAAFLHDHTWIRNFVKQSKICRDRPVGGWFILCIVIALLIGLCGFYWWNLQLERGESATIAHAMIAYETNRMVIDDPVSGMPNLQGWIPEYNREAISPVSIYLAVLSKIVGIVPTTFARVIYAPYLLMLSACAFLLLGYFMFHHSWEKAGILTAIVELAHGALLMPWIVSITHVHVRMWQGKYIFAFVILPFFLTVILQLRERKQVSDVQIVSTFFVLNLASCMSSVIGILVSAVLLLCGGCWFAKRRKQIRQLVPFVYSCMGTVIFGGIYYLLQIGQMIG